MRARGAQVTDIVVLVVAADDAVMPQTVEAINHAKAAKVPMIVAINKCDKPSANPTKSAHGPAAARSGCRSHVGRRAGRGSFGADWQGPARAAGGDQLQAEILELKANPTRAASGAVIEAKLDVGRGPVATVLVQNGTLKRGDIFVVGEKWGKVRALVNDKGETIAEAGPAVPVEVLGLNGTPEAGDVLRGRDRGAGPRDRRVPRESREGQARGGCCGGDAGTAYGEGQGRQGTCPSCRFW